MQKRETCVVWCWIMTPVWFYKFLMKELIERRYACPSRDLCQFGSVVIDGTH